MKLSKKLPLYKQLADALEYRIKTEHFHNNKLPSERELMKTYSLSRNTVRQAIEQLVIAEIVFRKRTSGTFINTVKSSTDSSKTVSRSKDIEKDDKEQKLKYQAEILDYTLKRANEDIAKDLGIKSDTYFIRITRVYLLQNKPVMIEKVYRPRKKSFNNLFDEKSKWINDKKYKEVNALSDDLRMNIYIFTEMAGTKDAKILQVTEKTFCTVIKQIIQTKYGKTVEMCIQKFNDTSYVYQLHYNNK
ncbi:GntR family transcriptional regulator [Pediococcus ethanolidurans]|uniref:DNA-binding transcriptional regulator, GntR family n=1 Tax=Pediococcus ethanolidurans TaxID=319653 RepID=A0A0R2K6U3_9LACO|nr:GntR family transcriptional regulator [Pediococcus ethanolidurans]KRN83574.1 hypothetical protein IV87_GL000043 [Pediococcus ethanolidurans]GEN94071.1 GntR family transcriptional regulator [Pediococcus ethanolidurans]SER04025.1 DNA-binding transcriptional regulator, GntR family [Pediococcus ethanolidurans]